MGALNYSATELETWLPIPSTNGEYMASSLGRIKSMHRISIRKDGKPLTIKSKILKPTSWGRGYLKVRIGKKSVTVHKLIAETFLNHITDGTHTLEIDHIDGDKFNNRVDNLQILTPRENKAKSIKNPTSKYIGVSWDSSRKKWIAGLSVNGKRKHLGRFNKEEDARDAYIKAVASNGEGFYQPTKEN